MIRITDNTRDVKLSRLKEKYPDDNFNINDIKKFSNTKIADLLKTNPALFIFPRNNVSTKDDIESQSIFELSEAENNGDRQITTHNIMGFIGCNDTQLTICSRFADDERDIFLHYMLHKVQNLNIMNFDISRNPEEQMYDFLPYLFPSYLNNALKQGLFKEYKRNKYNNANIKGAIDVQRHIRLNIPFAGKIAYTMREHSFDNPTTQLIHHTIEFLAGRTIWTNLLSGDSDMSEAVNSIRMNTPTYNPNDRQKIINTNIKPFRHPYFTEYKPLRQLCLQILRHEKLSYGPGKDKIYGLLFDGAWLWEEYLDTLLKGKFYHPRNKIGAGGYRLFEKSSEHIFPDFISKAKPYIIADAKYKHLERSNNENKNSRDHKDYYQLMAYMYRFNSTAGFLMYPHSRKIEPEVNQICDTAGALTLQGFEIPERSDSYDSFSSKMKESEKIFVEELFKN
jgi:5-methylcytosine-specific restriction endonuclease McrBC regulatory subunit McrC